MSEYIVGEILHMDGEPDEGICLGAGQYPEDVELLPVNEVDT
ncbi:MAG: hypothetical protein ACTH7L_14420 [Psychrobacter alimentarius]